MKSEDETRRHAFALADVIEGRTLREIVSVADEYRMTPGLAPATIDNRLTILKAVAKFAWRKEWIRDNLSPRIPLINPDNARDEYRSHAEVRRIIAKAPTPAGKAFIALAAYSGLRQSELMRLRREDIRGSVAYVRVSKTAEPRAVPVAQPGRPYLKAIPFTRSKWSLEWEWRKARDAAGFAGMRYHDLRHTFASFLINEGVDLYTVGQLLGNKTIPQRYAHLRLTTLRRAVGKIRA
jgi:integrase